MSINEMESKARELRQLQSLIEEATAEAEVLKDAIKAAMGDAEEVRAGEYRITWKQVTSSRLDTAALKKCLPEVAERFTKQTTIRRFCVALAKRAFAAGQAAKAPSTGNFRRTLRNIDTRFRKPFICNQRTQQRCRCQD